MLNETIQVLIQHHDWFNGKGVDKQDPIIVDEAIDHAIGVLMAVENLIKQRGRHNTEIAYKALEIATGK